MFVFPLSLSVWRRKSSSNKQNKREEKERYFILNLYYSFQNTASPHPLCEC